ncbi:hypothetical protein F4859DRAFT_509619 [Xylaria cf. heliscus]|nr:hypothetical protein F4859DRAFT_509619 [Xylaria cf. heliscus]
MTSRHCSPAPTHRSEPAPEPPRISLLSWLAVGGTGRPPTTTSFSRMASERKAAHRRDKAHEEARKAAKAEKCPAPPKEQIRPDRRELMRLYGPEGTARRRAGEEEGHDNRGDAGRNDNNNDGNGNEEGRNDRNDNNNGNDDANDGENNGAGEQH